MNSTHTRQFELAWRARTGLSKLSARTRNANDPHHDGRPERPLTARATVTGNQTRPEPMDGINEAKMVRTPSTSAWGTPVTT